MNAQPATPHPGLWVRSELLPDGTYGVGLNYGDDLAWLLNRGQSLAYAAACVAVATTAEHEAAVFASMTSRGIPDDAVAELILGIRQDRPATHADTHPLRFEPGVALADRHPFVKIQADGQMPSQVSPEALRQHAGGVLQALAAADLDAALLRALVSRVDLEEAAARAVIDDLGNHWPAERRPNRAERRKKDKGRR